VRQGRTPARPAGDGQPAPARLRRAGEGGAHGGMIGVETGDGGVADGWPPHYSAGQCGREPATDAWAPQHSTGGGS
jgi:hypothetical protein